MLDSLPPITSLCGEDRVRMFVMKLKACEEMYDFTHPRSDLMLKEQKRRHLVDIGEALTRCDSILSFRTCKPLMRMLSVNIIRTLPKRVSEGYLDAEENESNNEVAWPHLQLVYELFRKYIGSGHLDSDCGRDCLSAEMVYGMVEMFNSEDGREREYLKMVVHRIYGKVMHLRTKIKQAVMNVFHRVIYDGERFCGMAELLEIVGSIINGFAVPLKEEHKDLLRKGLLGLHVPSSLPTYHVQLCFCMTQYVEKAPELGAEILRFLVRHWPSTHSRKVVLLLNEIEEVMELTSVESLSDIVGALFRRIGQCIESAHFQVAERALFYWNNEYIVKVMIEYREIVVGAVIEAIDKNVRSHWNENVLSLSGNVQKLLYEMDGGLYERTMAGLEEERRREKAWKAQREMRWGVVYRMIKNK